MRQNTLLHLYEIGDLDDFFWPYTTWYATQEKQQVNQLALFYTAETLPVLLGITEEPTKMRALLQSILHILPVRFYTHLTDGMVSVLTDYYHIQLHGLHFKMALHDKTGLNAVDTTNIVQLSAADLRDIETLYATSYPGNWFDPRMLETGHYFGIRHGKRLISIAGVHVYSQRYKVAALGNITTHPDFRQQGLGTRVCAKLCQALLTTVDHIGLNVKADNASAIACYEHLGFVRIATYEEYSCIAK